MEPDRATTGHRVTSLAVALEKPLPARNRPMIVYCPDFR